MKRIVALLSLVVLLPAHGAGMLAVPRAEGYCSDPPDRAAVCREWRMVFDPGVRFVAYGYEDGIDYFFARPSGDGTYETLVAVHPVLRDDSRQGRLFWGYPGDITDIAAPDGGGRDDVLATFEHRIVLEGESSRPAWQARMPAVLFIGRTTQPEATVSVRGLAPMDLGEMRARAGG